MGYQPKIKNESKAERFWRKVNIPLDDKGEPLMEACWLWKGSCHGGGYGTFVYKGETFLAHRYSLELLLGRSIGEGLQANHVNDCNKRCCNWNHLYEGNQSQNMKDKFRNGKHVFTEAMRKKFARLARKRFKGSKRTPEVRQKMKQLARERWENMTEEEQVAQIQKMTPEWKRLGKPMPRRLRKRISATMMNHPVSEETKALMSAKAKARWAKHREEKERRLKEEGTT